MASGVHCKGVGMIAALDAGKADRDAFAQLLAPELRRYLDEPVSAADWYPAEDLLAILRAVARLVLPNATEQEAFEFFGTLSARRDLTGEQDQYVDPSRRSHVAGAFKGAVDPAKAPLTLLRHAAGLWLLYWDEGELEMVRSAELTARMRLRDFPFVSEQLCWLNTGFYKEVSKIVQIDFEVTHARCRCVGDDECAWDLTFPDETYAETLQSIRLLKP